MTERITKRRVLLKLGEWSAAAIVGEFAIKTLDRAEEDTGKSIEERRKALIERLVGSTVEIPVWTTQELLGIEFLFSHGPAGYLLKAKRIVRIYKDGQRCADAGKQLIELGMVIMAEEDLRIEVDMTEVARAG